MSESDSSQLAWATDRERWLEAQLAAVTAERDELKKLNAELYAANMRASALNGNYLSRVEQTQSKWLAAVEAQQALGRELDTIKAERDAAVAKLQALAEWLQAEQTVHSPWPTEVWPSTLSDCVEAIPNERDRGAISGTLMREGWQYAVQDLRDALAASEAESPAERISKACKLASEVAAQLAEARRVDPADLRIPFMASGGESEEAES